MVTVHGVLNGVSVAYQFADVETIATAAPDDLDEARAALLDLPEVEEAFTLHTCNRYEAYVVTDDVGSGASILRDHLRRVLEEHVRTYDHEEAIEHLLRVAAGLESQVLGENEILGQLRDAFHEAKDADEIGAVLEPALLTALHVGERARSETAINEGIVSLASAAVTCATERVNLPTGTVVLVGAGEVGAGVANSLATRDVGELFVANRSISAAEAAIEELGRGTAVSFEDLPVVLSDADVCISATASKSPVLAPDHVPRRSSLVLIDLGQPPDVSPSVRERASIAYYDLDRLREITERTHEQRADAAAEVASMVDEEASELHRRFKRHQAEEVITAMRSGAAAITHRELERAKSRMEHSDEPVEQIMEDLAESLMNSLMAPPTEGLRDAAEEDDWVTIKSAIQMFDPSLDIDELPEGLIEERAFATDD